MSAPVPEASTTRQRQTAGRPVKGNDAVDQTVVNETSTSDAPASLSTDPSKKVPRNEPKIKPPFANTSMNKFLTNLILVVFALAGFYVWRVTVWARDAGGYWNLITGSGTVAKDAAASAVAASSLAAAAITSATSTASKAARTAGKGAKNAASSVTSAAPADVQSRIFELATALGVPLADLSNAIRPLIDPTVPNPIDEVKRLREQLELQNNLHEQVVTHKEEAVQQEEAKKPSVLELMNEAFLD
ncbi:hypothetical protein NCC49_001575 [Naganishia albida]|nr:hypothetical protein NCC49_001575 [Naganishia albida]